MLGSEHVWRAQPARLVSRAATAENPTGAKSTRAWTSWASASSGGASQAPPGAWSIPTRPRGPSRPSSGGVRALTRRTAHPSLAALLRQLNPVLRGWCTYFRYGVTKATFGYLDEYAWRRVLSWIRRRYRKTKWAVLFRRFYVNWRPTEDDIVLFQPQTVTVSRYRYRAANIPTPWATTTA